MSLLAMGGSYVVQTPLGGFGIDAELSGKYVSDPSDIIEVEPVINDWWIKLADNPTTGMKVYLEGDEFNITSTQDVYEFDAINRALPVVVYGKARGRRLTLPINILGDDDYHQLMDLRAMQQTFVLQSPAGWQMYFRFDSEKTEAIRNTKDRYRLVQLPIIEVYHEDG